MNKKELLTQLIDHLQQEIDATLTSANDAHALASHEQSKPENQYDTLALEAAYLAHGQSKRIAEVQRQVMLLNHFEFTQYNDESRITMGALVCIQENETLQWFWLLPVAGGVRLKANESEVRTLTPDTPLAKKLLGHYLGDELVLSLGDKKMQFEIIELH